MSRYIDADLLADYAYLRYGGLKANEISIFPTADVEPVRHGRWIKMGYEDYECSNCKAALWARKVNPVEKYKYCWSCGAKMDGDADDQSGETDKD